MQFKTFGTSSNPTIILLHGGGLSWWSLLPVINNLSTVYFVVAPIIDGHGEDGVTTFVSIEDSGQKLINYIDDFHTGHVLALYGLSLGAQIVLEVLSQRDNIAEYAIIESGLAIPIKGVTALTLPIFNLSYGLIQKRWFSKIQAKALFVPPELFENYYQESLHLSKASLINIAISNGNYALKDSLSKTTARVLVIVGSKERRIMKKSAQKIDGTVKHSRLFIAEHKGHGELSLVNSSDFLDLLKDFLKNQTVHDPSNH